VAQILDGRPVEVGPILDAANPGSQSFAPQLAQQQADLHRAGFEPSMTAAELQAATEDLYGRPADADETDTSVAGIPRDADGNDSVRFRPGSETPGAAVAQGAEATAARPAAAPAQQGEGAVPAAASDVQAGAIPRPAWAGSAPPEVQGIINAPEVAEAIANPKIIRDKNVPDGAGYVAGGQTAVDPRIGDSWTIGDKTFDPAIPANIHEQTEHFEMERQIAAKQAELDRPLTDAETKAIYDNVHENIATVAEMAWVDAQGIDRKGYDEKWDGFLSATEHEDPTNAPAGLYLKPYDAAMADKLRAAGAGNVDFSDQQVGQENRHGPIPSEIPNGVQAFTPAELGVDPERFQFKAGGDQAGVTERLKGVTQWDPIKAGMSLVWIDKDGKPFIVDGHQRLALAKRIGEADPAQNPQVLARTLKETDGITPAMARAIAAMKNIAEGTGTSVDAAKIIRDHPQMAGDLPPRSELVRQARGLVNLDPDAFRMVINDVVPANYAAIVGRLAPEDGQMQGALLSLLSKTDPANATQAEAIVRQGIEAGTHVETQASLFGDQEVASNLYLERAKVLDRALKQLRRDKAVFSTLVKESDILEQAGNKLAKDINEKRATANTQALQILQILANRTGPISDALGDAAKRAKSEGSFAGAVRDFVGSVRKSASTGDLARLANGLERRDAGAGDEKPASTIERSIAGPVNEGEEAAATAAVDRAIHAPVAERGAEGLPQLVLPGAEQSARQAAAAREAQGPGIRSEAEQEAPGGLFAPPQAEGEQASLFGPYEIKTPDLDRDLAEAEHDIGLLQLTPEDRAEIDAAGQEVNLAGLTEQAYAQAAECLAGAI